VPAAAALEVTLVDFASATAVVARVV